MTSCEIEGGKGTAKGLLVSATIGGLTGIAGGKGANGAKLRGVYSRANEVLNRAVSPKKIAQYTAKIAYVKEKTTTAIVNTLSIGIVNKYIDKRTKARIKRYVK